MAIDFLVTGGAGFIGSHLVERLLSDGRRVRVLDDFSSGKRANLEPFLSRIDFIEGTIVDPAVCGAACDGVSVVLHEAAMPSVPKSIEDPAGSHQVNINGTFNLLMAARDAKVRRFIYAASSSAYGESPTLPKHENITPDPLSPYGVQKLTAEYYCRAFHRCYGLETLALRYFNVFGPRQDPKSQYAAAIPAFITSILRGESPTVYGDGEQTRDFTYIDNVVQANLLAAEAEGVSGEAVNIACGERLTVNDVIAEINGVLGTDVRSNHVAERAGDIKDSWADIKLAERVIGFRPIMSFAEGLKRTIEWYQKKAPASSGDGS